jgi:hypothetical protein
MISAWEKGTSVAYDEAAILLPVGAGEQRRRNGNAQWKAACQGHSGSPAKRKCSAWAGKQPLADLGLFGADVRFGG